LNFTTSVNAVADAVRIKERAGSGTIVFVTPSSSPLSTHLRLMHDYQSLFYLEDMFSPDRRPRSTSSKPTLQSECWLSTSP
jgi:hypothetical protein